MLTSAFHPMWTSRLNVRLRPIADIALIAPALGTQLLARSASTDRTYDIDLAKPGALSAELEPVGSS